MGSECIIELTKHVAKSNKMFGQPSILLHFGNKFNMYVVLKVLDILEGPASAVPWVGLWSVIFAFLLAL